MNKLKLTTLSEKILKEKESKALLGGKFCECSCYWAGNSGSSVSDNQNANYNLGISSQHGCNQYFKSDNQSGSYPEAEYLSA